jgi:hypothetical protein
VDDPILQAGRVILPFLDQLVDDPVTAAGLRTRIDELLDEAAKGEDTSAELRVTLESDEATKEFTRKVIRDAPYFRPPGQQLHKLRDAASVGQSHYSPLPGWPEDIGAPKYVCPYGDTVWYRPDISFPIRECTEHHVLLVEVTPDVGT